MIYIKKSFGEIVKPVVEEMKVEQVFVYLLQIKLNFIIFTFKINLFLGGENSA